MKTIFVGGLMLMLSAVRLWAQAPVFTTQPTSQAVVLGTRVVLFTGIATSAQSVTYQWRKNGTDVQDSGSAVRGAKTSTLQLGDVSFDQIGLIDSGTYTVVATNSSGATSSAPATLFIGQLVTVPTASPSDSTVTAGSSATFSIVAGGTTPLTYQWSKDGAPLLGATASSLLANNVQSGNAGVYSVVVSNQLGSAASRGARLIVTPAPVPPVITTQPVAVAAFVGGTVSLSVAAVSPADLAQTYQWLKDGVAITTGANSSPTNATLQLSNLTFANSGVYVVRVTNSAGFVQSNAVVLNVVSTVLPTWRFINVSTRTQVGSGANILIQGFVIAGNASKQVLVRAVGPTLSIFGVDGTLASPSLAVYQGTTLLAQNTVWGGTTALSNAFTATGAFQLPATSRDSALLLTLPPGSYTAQISGVGGATGVALVEVYELP